MALKLKYFHLVVLLSIVTVFGDELNGVDGEFRNSSDDKNNVTSVSSSPDTVGSSTISSSNNADIKKVSLPKFVMVAAEDQR